MSATSPQSVSKRGTILGEVAKPPFAVLPDPSTLFKARSRRLAALAPGHELEPYLRFLAALTHAQHDIAAALPASPLPPFERIGQALEYGMPPVSYGLFQPDAAAMAAIEQLLDRLASTDVPAETTAAIASLRAAPADDRRARIRAAIEDAEPADDLAQRALLAAG